MQMDPGGFACGDLDGLFQIPVSIVDSNLELTGGTGASNRPRSSVLPQNPEPLLRLVRCFEVDLGVLHRFLIAPLCDVDFCGRALFHSELRPPDGGTP